MSYLAIDFGGTWIRAAWFNHGGELVSRRETPSKITESTPEQVTNRIIEIAEEICPAQPIAIGIAAPGPLNPKTGVIYHARTLPGWSEFPLSTVVSNAFGDSPGYVENDANLAALAESQQGVGTGYDPIIYLTISTGIGGGMILDGHIFSGGNGIAFEPGHQCFRLQDGSVCKLEELASGTAIGNIAAKRLLASSQDSILREVSEITGEAVGIAALADDAFAIKIIQEAGAWLGLGIVNLLHLFAPQRIILGGSVMNCGDLIVNSIRRTIEDNIMDADFYPEGLLQEAHFGDDVCLVGAYLYAKQVHEGNH